MNGAQRWVARYNGPGNDIDGATGLGVSPDGFHVFVTGTSHDDATGDTEAAATVAYGAATGRQQWASRYDGPLHYANGRDLAVSPDGTKVYIVGSASRGTQRHEDYATVVYNTANGTQQWAALYNGPTSTDDYGTAIAASPNAKTVFVTGLADEEGSPPGGTQPYATIAYSAS